MDQRELLQLHEASLVPYRVTDTGVEFCLVTPMTENRWEFPKIAVDVENARPLAQLEVAAVANGLIGHLQGGEPLGQYASARGNESRTMAVFLMRVVAVDDAWPLETSYRRRWCLAEEARARIRRKPLRGFIDISLRRIDTQNGKSAPSSNGHSTPARGKQN